MIARHNLAAVRQIVSVGRPTSLTLSEVARPASSPDDALTSGARGRRAGRPEIPAPPTRPSDIPHDHDARLCVTCTARRHAELNPSARRHHVSVELVAARIRRDDGDVWGAINAFDISYRHACRIRNGWRPGGRRAPAIPYRSRGWISGARVGGWIAAVLAAGYHALDAIGTVAA